MAIRTSTGYVVPPGASVHTNGTISHAGRCLGTDDEVPSGRGVRVSAKTFQRRAHARYGTALNTVPLADRCVSDDEEDSSRSESCRSCAGMRALVAATERMRELEARAARVASGNDASARRDADVRVRRAQLAVQKLSCLPTRDTRAAAEELRRAWRRDRPALTRMELRARGAPLPTGTAAHLSQLVVRVVPSWYVAAACVRSVRDVRRVLEHLRSRHDTRWFDAAQRHAVPSPAVPPPHPCEDAARLQNLPADQHARVALLAAWIRNMRPLAKEVAAACAALDVRHAHAVALRRYGANVRRTTRA
mgnify:CR=1 FL=1|jgi:hypothetical protein